MQSYVVNVESKIAELRTHLGKNLGRKKASIQKRIQKRKINPEKKLLFISKGPVSISNFLFYQTLYPIHIRKENKRRRKSFATFLMIFKSNVIWKDIYYLILISTTIWHLCYTPNLAHRLLKCYITVRKSRAVGQKKTSYLNKTYIFKYKHA